MPAGVNLCLFEAEAGFEVLMGKKKRPKVKPEAAGGVTGRVAWVDEFGWEKQ